MCIAIVKPSGVKMPSRDILKVCFKNNPDGAGFAYNRNGRNYLHKGYFTFKEFYDALSGCRIKQSEAALIHFRVATHGNIDKSTCHPFLITGNYDDMKITHLKSSGAIMIHNGMLNLYDKDITISDSMILSRQLYNLDLSKIENRAFIELALQNNNKSKVNRLGILYSDNTTDHFGFKEPWEEIDGCFYSNKSYQKSFTRGKTLTQVQIDAKLDYDENEIQSSKVSFCINRKNGCNELADYYVHSDKDKSDPYCSNCISNINFFACKICRKDFYADLQSPIKKICKDCYTENKDFLSEHKCECGQIANKKANDNKQYYCNHCANIKTFVCNECNNRFTFAKKSKVTDLCIDCYDTTKHGECLYCKTKNNLIRSNYSTICFNCLKSKNGKTCFLCNRKFIYGDNKVGSLTFCSKCVDTKLDLFKVMNKFGSFKFLNNKQKYELYDKMSMSKSQLKEEVLKLYKHNDFYNRIKQNYNIAISLLNKKVEN